MSKHNKTYFAVKLSTILILIALAFTLGIKTSQYIKDVQAKKAAIDTIAN